MIILFDNWELCINNAYPSIEEILEIRKTCEEYVYEMKNNDNINKLNKRICEKEKKEFEKIKNKKKEPRIWYVYFIRDSQWYTKIWWSKNPIKRLSTFITENSWEMTLVHQIYCNDRFKRESEFHNMFSEKRMNWEWFDLSDSDINKILSIKK